MSAWSFCNGLSLTPLDAAGVSAASASSEPVPLFSLDFPFGADATDAADAVLLHYSVLRRLLMSMVLVPA